MALTTITDSGHIEIPPDILQWLKLKPGDSVELALNDKGYVYLKPVHPVDSVDVRDLSGILYQAGQAVVTLADMDDAIAQCAGESN